MAALKNFGKILFLTFILAGSLVLSRVILFQLGVEIPRLPQQADENTAVYYLLTGSLFLAAGWFFLIKDIGGSLREKTLISWLFIFIGFSIGITIESAIYSDVESYHLTVFLLIIPAILYAFVASLMTHREQPSRSCYRELLSYFKKWSKGIWLRKIVLAIVSFPVIYFVFGMIAAPFVLEYYSNDIEGLALPPPGTIILVQLIRSTLFLIITIPVIISWTSSKTRLVLSLTIAHFVMVFAYDIYLAIVMPLNLVLIHGIEIFAVSFVYSWILVKILWQKYHSYRGVSEDLL